ncbi:hypothetical protein J6TS2_39630 [Heyndrickxia sporothermodurans]|nr:hypothetical protein J6TS2_39630 [Heyndrickxia sporothermodurans]
MNKKLTKLSLAAILSATLVMPSSIYAASSKSKTIIETKMQDESESNTGAALVDPNYTQNEEYYKSLEEERDKQIEKEEQVFQRKQAAAGMLAATNEYYTISVTYNKQQYWNFCGVAAGRQALSFHKSKSRSSERLPSQEHFGRSIGTLPEVGGTKSTFLAKGLNQYKYVYKFSGNPYIVGNIRQFAKPAVALEKRVKSTLRNKKTAPILLARTDFLDEYKGRKFRHYVTVSGYDKNADKFRLVDSNHYTQYTHGGTYWSRLRTTTSGKGIAKAVYVAEGKKGKNPVMVW